MRRILVNLKFDFINYLKKCMFLPIESEGATQEEIVATLKDSGAEILLSYLGFGDTFTLTISLPPLQLRHRVPFSVEGQT